MFIIYLTNLFVFVMGGNCCDVPCCVTHPIYSWFGRECGGCGPHIQGKTGQKCASFWNPHARSPHKNYQYSRQAVVRNEMWPCESSQRGVEEGAFVDCVILPNFFHCSVRLTINVVCVTSSTAECGKTRLVSNKNFCVFCPHHHWKKRLYKKFHYPI